MIKERMQVKMETLALSDGDDVELLNAIEGSFGVRFGDETITWFTVGDVYRALLEKVPSQAGSCSTSMVFYRLRRILASKGDVRGPVGPKTHVKGLVKFSPKHLYETLSHELGIALPSATLSWWGVTGVLIFMIGLPCIFLSLADHARWPSLLLIPLGLLMTATDVGTYGSLTVGDIARRIAARNFAHYVAAGADARPAAVWGALRDLIADQVDFDRDRITPDLRLIA